MKKFVILGILSMLGLYSLAVQRITIDVQGPESKYNQIRVVNETSQENFRCRVVRLTTEGEPSETFGVYDLKEKGDSDSKTNWVYQGEHFVLDLPKDFPVEVSYTIEYQDLPLFDAVVIHLFDTNEFDALK